MCLNFGYFERKTTNLDHKQIQEELHEEFNLFSNNLTSRVQILEASSQNHSILSLGIAVSLLYLLGLGI